MLEESVVDGGLVRGAASAMSVFAKPFDDLLVEKQSHRRFLWRASGSPPGGFLKFLGLGHGLVTSLNYWITLRFLAPGA